MADTLTIRLNEQERGLLEAYAREAGLGVSAYARRVLREHVGLDEAARGELAALAKRVERLEGMAGL